MPAMLVVFVLAGCGGARVGRVAEDLATATSTVAASAATATATAAPAGRPCLTGRLTVGDLEAADAALADALAAAQERAAAWQADARLYRLRLGCAVLEPRFRWQATYYSDVAQLFFETDTGETTPAEVDPSDVATLPTDPISFVRLRRSLTKAGYTDGTTLSPATGVDIRLNTAKQAFGPPDAPKDAVYFHVAIDHRGEIKDLFVSAVDGTVYQYRL